MNFLRITLLSSMVCCGAAHAMENPFGDAQQELATWAGQKNEQIIALNGGFAPDDLNHGIILFIREHAEQIGKEIEYIIDHCNAQEAALFNAALEVFIRDYAAHSLPLVKSMKESKAITAEEVACVSSDFNNFWNAIKTFLSHNAPEEHCPVLHEAFKKLPFLETLAGEYAEIFKKHIDSFNKLFNQVDMQKLPFDIEATQEAIDASKNALSIIQAHMKTEEHKKLLKNVVHAWVACMKEDAFFEAVQHNKTVIRTGHADEQQPLPMPESLLKLMFAAQEYGESFQKAIFAAEYAQYMAILAEQGIDIEKLAAEALAQAQAEDEDTNSDAVEYDFNARFEQRHKV